MNKAEFNKIYKSITSCQHEVLEPFLQGKNDAEIADLVGFPEATVRQRLREIRKKFNITMQDGYSRNEVRDRVILIFCEFKPELVCDEYRKTICGWVRPPIYDLPEGVIPLDSPYYIERDFLKTTVEKECYKRVKQPGSLIRIKAPKKMGKTSLLIRILDKAEKEGYSTALLDFDKVETAIFEDEKKFGQWFCAYVSRLLGKENKVRENWDDLFGVNASVETYFEDYFLQDEDNVIVLGLDNLDRVFEQPDIANDFCHLLRGFHINSASNDEVGKRWRRLRLVLSHATEFYVSFDFSASPLNGVGFVPDFTEFGFSQVQDFCTRCHQYLTDLEIQQLMSIIAGHPYLVKQALAYLLQDEKSVDTLLKIAPTLTSPFNSYLGKLGEWLSQDDRVVSAYSQIVTATKPVTFPFQEIDYLKLKLDALGLVTIQEDYFSPRCELYRLYFQQRLSN